ncbi:hypothetical protein RF11_09257 [Thelohanellus kitauei]|uniref:Uncharacterized protein n=1 Tax=Thelohanellus kitauei TaxID=669202 RepID=A0A0C2J6Q1_THEKT|nr:hypothetical protein RF11_09257 [Thelohanellus kitauei]
MLQHFEIALKLVSQLLLNQMFEITYFSIFDSYGLVFLNTLINSIIMDLMHFNFHHSFSFAFYFIKYPYFSCIIASFLLLKWKVSATFFCKFLLDFFDTSHHSLLQV